MQRTLAKMLHALVLTIVFGLIAMAEPLPLICDGGVRPHAVRPRSARTIQISKQAPMNPAIR